jgi:hypothetical protein
MQFEYPEDREFFANLLAGGNVEKFEKEFSEYFDFRHPAIKRWEFNKQRKKLLEELVRMHDGKCQLRIHPECGADGIFEPDHIVPLSSNELNKKLRSIKRTSSEKVAPQSFGSNHIKNLTLACRRCNAFKKHRFIIPRNLYSDDISYLPHRIESEVFSLSSGSHKLVQKYFQYFNEWDGAPIPNTYNGKAVVDWNGEPLFAELAVLRLFELHGWSGVWVDSYRKKYRVGLPDVVEPVEIPEEKMKLLDDLREKTGRYGGCWDILVWKDDGLLFIELKRDKKDRIQDSQKLWLEASIAHGLTANNFALVEWGVRP